MAQAGSLAPIVERYLACPRCQGPLGVRGQDVFCRDHGCGFGTVSVDGVVVLGDRSNVSFFDERHHIMEQSNSGKGIRSVFYDPQSEILSHQLAPGSVVVDAGCGPALPYARRPDWVVIGVDPSFDSVRSNRAVDLQIYGTASELPLPDASVDAVLCFYSIHHMTGRTKSESIAQVRRALTEFGRVIKPGGRLFVFEVSPWRPFWLLEQGLWPVARRVLGRKLDMFFYAKRPLTQLGRAAIPGAVLRLTTFPASWSEWFPPVFSIQRLKMPRALYPFHVCLYCWQF